MKETNNNNNNKKSFACSIPFMAIKYTEQARMSSFSLLPDDFQQVSLLHMFAAIEFRADK